MRCRKNKLAKKLAWRRRGSIMPFLAVSFILFLGTVGIASEMTRIFETIRQLEFAAQVAALYGNSLAVNNDGTYSVNNAQGFIQNGVLTAGNNLWNIAQCGPSNNIFASGGLSSGNIWSEPVAFASSDIQFVSNPNSGNEFFTQVTARREGNDALQQFFLPLFWLYSNNIGSRLPAQQFKADLVKTIEVIWQPALRIGAGIPPAGQSNVVAGTAWTALPLAISNQEFALAANPGQSTTTYTINLVSPATTGIANGNSINGCLVNLAVGTGTGNNYYASASGNQAISQLISLLNYFVPGNQQFLLPAMLEIGSQLQAFDPTASAFVNAQNQIYATLAKLPINRFYLIPVLANNPNFSTSNTVVGFARLYLDSVNTSTNPATGQNTVNSLTIDIGESIPLPNAASLGHGYSDIPGNNNNVLPLPVAPFAARTLDTNTNGISVKPRGIVMAPAISPRQVIAATN